MNQRNISNVHYKFRPGDDAISAVSRTKAPCENVEDQDSSRVVTQPPSLVYFLTFLFSERHRQRESEDNLQKEVSSSTTSVLGIELKALELAAGAFTH